jgi:HTH-type transcriptional regulator, competence development regulator
MDRTFGQRIKELREQHSFTLREVAQAVDITAGYLSLLENNKHVGLPSEETICKIAELYKAQAEELILLADKLPSDEYEAIKTARKNGTVTREHIFELLTNGRTLKEKSKSKL